MKALPKLVWINLYKNFTCTQIKKGFHMNTSLSGKEAYSLVLTDYPDVLTIDHMCQVLGVSSKTCYKLLKEGRVNCLKVGRTYRIPKAHLLSYLMIQNSPSTI